LSTFDWTLTRNEILTKAYRKIGGIPLGGALGAAQIAEGGDLLNALVQNIQSDGTTPLWTISEQVQVLDAAASSLTMDASVIDIDHAFIRDDTGYDHPVELISRFRFSEISDKAQTGRPTQIWAEKASPLVLHLYPVTDVATYALHYFRVRRLQDFDAAGDTGIIPDRWILPLIYLLAAILAPDYGIPLEERRELERVGGGLLAAAKRGSRETQDNEFVEGCY